MRLIIGVHPPYYHFTEGDRYFLHFKEFLKPRGKEKTFLFIFASPGHISATEEFAIKNGIPKERIFTMFPQGHMSSFSSYSEEFSEKLETINKNLLEGEKIELLGFGGAVDICYDSIFSSAFRVLLGKFGKRIIKARTALPFVYGQRVYNLREELRKKLTVRKIRRHL